MNDRPAQPGQPTQADTTPRPSAGKPDPGAPAANGRPANDTGGAARGGPDEATRKVRITEQAPSKSTAAKPDSAPKPATSNKPATSSKPDTAAKPAKRTLPPPPPPAPEKPKRTSGFRTTITRLKDEATSRVGRTEAAEAARPTTEPLAKAAETTTAKAKDLRDRTPKLPTSTPKPKTASQPTAATPGADTQVRAAGPATEAPARGFRMPSKNPAAVPPQDRPRAAPAARPAAKPVHQVRRARLRLTRIDPWSVMKTSLLLSIAFGIATLVSVMVVWSVLDAAGVWDSINSTVRQVVGSETSSDFDVTDYVNTSRVLGVTTLVAIIDVVLITALATLGSFLYNMAAALLGGVEMTLAEDQR